MRRIQVLCVFFLISHFLTAGNTESRKKKKRVSDVWWQRLTVSMINLLFNSTSRCWLHGDPFKARHMESAPLIYSIMSCFSLTSWYHFNCCSFKAIWGETGGKTPFPCVLWEIKHCPPLRYRSGPIYSIMGRRSNRGEGLFHNAECLKLRNENKNKVKKGFLVETNKFW